MISYQLRQREYLLQISRAMTARLDLPSLLSLILSSAAEMVQAEAGVIALHRGTGTTLSIRASYGIPGSLLSRFAPLLTDFPASAREYAIPDLEERLTQVAKAIRLPLRQVVALPLTVEERLLGLIYLFRSGSIAFSNNDHSVLGSFADQAAIAVRNAQLYQQVSTEKQQLDAIIERSADGVMILDPALHIRVFNQALTRMTGWPAERALGRPCYEVLSLEVTSGQNLCGAEVGKATFPDGKPVSAEGTLTRPGGSQIAVSVTYTPLYYEDGELSNVIANVVDITRFREAEEMKSTFVSVVSHELKTPVALIKGYADTLAREDAQWDANTARESLQIIGEEADRLNDLINNLLDASRIQAGAFKIERAELCLPVLAERVVDNFRTQTDNHRFVLDFPKDYPDVLGDEERLRQVFNNLIGNAIKYSPRGGEIRVGGWADRDWATVYVADQGIGIPAEDQANLFQRFYRVDSGLRRATQGTGLGLYLCRSIIEAHGGRIWLRSEPGKGTTMFFSLPLANPNAGPSEKEARS
ncbi:MAG TPA: ATP-binding protein [Anaerolineae bacterium]